ncbi:MAG: dephospho-CoA kinase [Clostridia bacterium]
MNQSNAIAIFGGIGSGKSVVGAYLERKGYAVVYCDKIAMELSEDSDVISEVERKFGQEFIINGALNRQYIRENIFNDGSRLSAYNAIFHLRIQQRILNILSKSNELLFVEVPLINALPSIEWKQVWEIIADESTRIERVCLRDKVTKDNVKRIVSKQTDIVCKSIIIVNDGSLSQLYDKVDKLLEQI